MIKFIKLYQRYWNVKIKFIKVSCFLASWYNFLLFVLLPSYYKGINFHVLDILLTRQLWNYGIRFENNLVVTIKWNIWSFTQIRRLSLVRYLVLYTLNGKKANSLFIEFREEILSRKVSKFAQFTKFSPQQSFSVLNVCL